MLIYKIFRTNEWFALQANAQTLGAPVDLADGYIHFSTATQTPQTASKHFAGVRGLILAAVKTKRLGNALVWEVSRGGAQFPHLYAPLRLQDIAWYCPLLLIDDRHQFPDYMV